jgi:pimeloyl-ACP methyl ester carboxylesterase
LKSAQLPNGLTLPYFEQGDPSGIPMILLHGVTDSWRSFECVLPLLPRSIHAFALTQRGHGDADRPVAGYRTQDFASDLAAFADQVGIRSAVVVGHSMGGTNALRFAIDYPERTLGLVLVGSFASYRTSPAILDFWETAVSQLSDPLDPDFVRNFQESTLARPLPEPFLEMVVEESRKVPARVWRAAFAGFLEDSVLQDLNKIQAPTLLLWGDQDAFCSRGDQETLLAAIAGSRLVVYPNTGHALHWEEPERFASDLIAFCPTPDR